MFKYTLDNKRYHTLNYFYKTKFNSKVFKVSLNANLDCPNRDGSIGNGGCIYCSPAKSGDFAGNPNDDLINQFNEIKAIMHKKWPEAKYIGYFQAGTNTYTDVDNLKNMVDKIIKQENVIGINIATRPDCITDSMYNYLEELSKQTFLTIELGLQSMHNKTLKLINRGHDLESFDNCFKELKKRNINVLVHIINGLPYETKNMMIDTVKYLNSLNIDGIKIHMLHITKNTPLEKLYNKEKFHILTKEEYIDIVIDQLELLNDKIVINRLTGDPVSGDLIEPKWLLKKFCVLNDIDKEMVKRNTYQGKRVN